MRTAVCHPVALLGALLVFGCDTEIDDLDEGPTPGEWAPLVEAEFSVEPGEERYYCIRKFFTEDTYFAGFETISPVGVHHTVITSGAPDGPDDIRDCTSFDHHFEAFLYEGSSSEDRFEFPPGIAALVEGGEQLNINIHIQNTTDEPLTGTMGHLVKLADASDVEETAQMIYAGIFQLFVPPGESTHIGDCEVPIDLTAFATVPHMHAYGTHQKVVARSSVMGDVTVHDENFDFDTNKSMHLFEQPVPMKVGDVLEVSCSYNNTTGAPLVWGEDSYTAEMCFAGTYVYPTTGINSACSRP